MLVSTECLAQNPDNAKVPRDIVGQAQFEKLLSTAGVAPDTAVVLHGDTKKWFAAWGAWVFDICGVKNVKLLDGGRKEWEKCASGWEQPIHWKQAREPSGPPTRPRDSRNNRRLEDLSMSQFEVGEIVQALHAVRDEWRDSQRRSREPVGREFPSREAMAQVVESLKGALFPMRLGPPDLRHESEDFYVGHTLDSALQSLRTQARLELHYVARHEAREDPTVDDRAVEAARDFGASLPGLRRLLDGDVMAAYQGDPAARSVDEVLLCYPGILAMIHHRLAHRLYQLGLPLLARIVAELAHSETGIDIHPGAQIDAGFFIDHGTGVVIGETAIIGKRVRVYQAVTLGAKRFPTDAEGNLQKGMPRHPLVEDDVVIYAGATILGRVTIGKGATIGGNVWITDDVPAGASVSQASLQPRSPC